MLSNLSIKNYAIIKNLDISLSSGFCVLTGETGAGKSIIMGALTLILGQRADTSVIKDQNKKCIIEGKFSVEHNETLKLLFEENDLDYELPVILRREITPSGKSRAFVNDTPVQLNIIREIGLYLIDIHSQHSNLELGNRKFQLNVIDWYCSNTNLLDKYSRLFSKWKQLEKQYDELNEKKLQTNADIDYYEFQYKQLSEANLTSLEQSELESEQELLSHSEEIKAGLIQVNQLLDGEEFDALTRLKDATFVLQKLTSFLPAASELHKRLESQFIELRDVAQECEQLAEKTEFDPSRLEFINDRLNTIYELQQKHRVSSIDELIMLRDEFEKKINEANSYDEDLEILKKAIEKQKGEVLSVAQDLHDKRALQVGPIASGITDYLKQLGMPNAVFNIEIKKKSLPGVDGADEVFFMFTANKGGKVEEINKVASGGELSRLMLAIKTVVAKSKALPAIIFDEIDSGISGEIASKMGVILEQMSKYMQVINITHLPQIASRANSHYLVFKNENETDTETSIRLLKNEERVLEIAKMLSSDKPHEAAIENARALMAK